MIVTLTRTKEIHLVVELTQIGSRYTALCELATPGQVYCVFGLEFFLFPVILPAEWLFPVCFDKVDSLKYGTLVNATKTQPSFIKRAQSPSGGGG